MELKSQRGPSRHSEMILAQNRGRNPDVWLWDPAAAGHCGAADAEPREYERRVIGCFENHNLAPSRAAVQLRDAEALLALTRDGRRGQESEHRQAQQPAALSACRFRVQPSGHGKPHEG